MLDIINKTVEAEVRAFTLGHDYVSSLVGPLVHEGVQLGLAFVVAMVIFSVSKISNFSNATMCFAWVLGSQKVLHKVSASSTAFGYTCMPTIQN